MKLDLKKEHAKSQREKLERQLEFQIKAAGLPKPEKEHRFHPERKWRFDFAYPDKQIAIECEGGTWSKKPGRHNRGSGFEKDCEKYNAAASLGWLVLRFTSTMIASGKAITQIEEILNNYEQIQRWMGE